MLTLSTRRSSARNAILANLPLSALTAISSFLEPVVLKERVVLQEPRKTVDRVLFVESGVVSLRVVSAGTMLETAVLGYRGAVGAASLFGGHVPTHQSVVLFPGNALSISVNDLGQVMNEHPTIRGHLASYVQALATQCAQSGLCGVCHRLEQRLACWLCLTRDALDSDILPVTHNYLSVALGLPRAGVTRALIRFESEGLVRKMRGVLQLHDRRRLLQRACRCYTVVASAHMRQMNI
ncbi:Crp/Fnr family transcriptional regulator [Bradyrhizobium canariense]|uniref:cAMP-binding domain of CRP or a regulatory subunit of cAMP-dependent protein kinases n=1 Tax=Bradyrhizobium canariense TaxID=255045 RepID=A0A1H1V7Y4_9BRAD|nr:cAMP-binding domain of CRP or a regulatory subunit of cAMP-dependent protein kinases [Bradyrhizobium canariense]